MSPRPSARKPPSCRCCDRAAEVQCPRCGRKLGRCHAPLFSGDCCEDCEAEYRPFSLENVAIRLGAVSLGTLAGATIGFLIALLVGSVVFVEDPIRVRVLAMAAVMLGTAFGFGSSNVAASTIIRARFLARLPRGRIPAARAVRIGQSAIWPRTAALFGAARGTRSSS